MPAKPAFADRALAYLEDTRRPVYSAILVLPFLCVYEAGVWMLGSKTINGGDAVIRRILGFFSVHTAFASALVLMVCFLVWQWRTKASFKTEPRKVGLLFFESLVLAELLFRFLGWLSLRLPAHQALPAAAPGLPARGHLYELVLYCGAGVYEELVFRVLLLSLLILVLTKLFQMEKVQAAVWAVVLGAVLFSLFHYIGPGADRLTLNGFLQRSFAGVYFAAIYVTRSFGVAAAAHALYDVRVGLAQMLS